MEWSGAIGTIADVAVLLVVAAIGFLFRSISSHAERIAKLEAAGDAVDVITEVKDVHKRVDTVAEAVGEQSGQLKQMNRTLDNIHKALIRVPE